MVDGINTGSLALGTVGSPADHDFLEEIEVITGGYNAEYGRSTGGVISVVTKAVPTNSKARCLRICNRARWLVPAIVRQAKFRRSMPKATLVTTTMPGSNSVVRLLRTNCGSTSVLHQRLCAPIFTARSTGARISRVVNPDGKLSDCVVATETSDGNADGKADKDPATGLFITDKVDDETRYSNAKRIRLLAN